MYYKVLAKCGHVRRNRYILKWFYLKADDGVNAARIARNTPRVKHDHKDAIRKVVKIDFEQYIDGLKIMANDMFFQVHSSSDQKLYNYVKEEEIYSEVEETKYKKERNGQRLRISIKEMIKEVQGGWECD